MRLDRYLEAAIRAKAFPGAAVAFGRADEKTIVRCYGHLTYAGDRPVTPRTRYDVLCLTKPFGVGALLARLAAEHGFDLHAPVADTLPAFGTAGKSRISWVHLLAHAGGLAPSRSYERLRGRTRDEVVAGILAQPPRFEPGTRFEYSCDGFVVLGLALERLAQKPLDVLVAERVLVPLSMSRAGYARPDAPFVGDVAPTEYAATDDGRTLHGRVCEPLARALGDVAGNTGLFACIDDVARFARAWLGHAPGAVPLFDPAITSWFQRPVDPIRLGTTGLAWDTRSPEGYTVAGRALGPRSFGHTGASGCSLWMDPDDGTWVALLTNAIHRDGGRRRYLHVRPWVSEMAAAILRAPST